MSPQLNCGGGARNRMEVQVGTVTCTYLLVLGLYGSEFILCHSNDEICNDRGKQSQHASASFSAATSEQVT